MADLAPAAGTPASGGGTDTFWLVAQADAGFAAHGPLTFGAARAARLLGLKALAGAGRNGLQIDCAHVTAADSAGLAVLLDWLAAAKQSGRPLRFTNLPAGLLALGRISEVEDLLTRGV